MKHLELKIEGEGLWNEDMLSKFEDFIMPHQYLIHTFLLINRRQIHYFEVFSA